MRRPDRVDQVRLVDRVPQVTRRIAECEGVVEAAADFDAAGQAVFEVEVSGEQGAVPPVGDGRLDVGALVTVDLDTRFRELGSLG